MLELKSIFETSQKFAHFADDADSEVELQNPRLFGRVLCGTGSAREGKSQEGELWDQAWKGSCRSLESFTEEIIFRNLTCEAARPASIIILQKHFARCVDGPLLAHRSWRGTYNFGLQAKTENWSWGGGGPSEETVQRMKV